MSDDTYYEDKIARINAAADDEQNQLDEIIMKLRTKNAALQEENAELRAKKKHGCQLCGGPHNFDTSVPSPAWNRVIRGAGLPDTLCASCILRAFVLAGESFFVTLWGDELHGTAIEILINGKAATTAAETEEHLLGQIGELREDVVALEKTLSAAVSVNTSMEHKNAELREAVRQRDGAIDAMVQKAKEKRDRIKTLEERDAENAERKSALKDQEEYMDLLTQRMLKAEKTLRFYGKERNHLASLDREGDDRLSPIELDRGARAREAVPPHAE